MSPSAPPVFRAVALAKRYRLGDSEVAALAGVDLEIAAGELAIEPGGVPEPTVTYKISADNYVKLANGELNGSKAFLTRKLKVSGSIPMAQKMNKFLPPAS